MISKKHVTPILRNKRSLLDSELKTQMSSLMPKIDQIKIRNTADREKTYDYVKKSPLVTMQPQISIKKGLSTTSQDKLILEKFNNKVPTALEKPLTTQ